MAVHSMQGGRGCHPHNENKMATQDSIIYAGKHVYSGQNQIKIAHWAIHVFVHL